MACRRTNLLIAAGLVLAALHGPLACTKAPASPTRIDMPQNGFSVTAPGGFEKHTPTQPHIVLAMDRRPGGGKVDDVLIITVVDMTDPKRPPTLEAQLDAAKGVIAKNHPEATYGPVQTTTIDGADARIYSLNYQANGKPVRSHRMITHFNGKVYMLLYTSDQSRTSEADGEFDSIVSSIKWSGK